MVFQVEGNESRPLSRRRGVIGRAQKFQVLTDQVSTAQTESGMVFAKLNEIFVIFEHLRIALQIIPIQMIDAVGRLKTIVHAFLVA